MSITNIFKKIIPRSPESWVGYLSFLAWAVSTIISFRSGTIVAYGDAESHLNIAKRVVDSLTPGFAQLGGIWLPLPHILLMPFVTNDLLWRTGLAGSIVSGAAFIISAIFIYKLAYLLTNNRASSLVASGVFIANPNILYLSTTPMTEMTLIVFFVLSSYYFISYIKKPERILFLVAASFFACCASLSRYDGWGLVLMEAGLLFLFYVPMSAGEAAPATNTAVAPGKAELAFERAKYKRGWSNLEGYVILFSTLAFFGIALWFAWDGLILGDPLYFTHSPFSANSQQQNWHDAGELPAYHNLPLSLEYYSYTSFMNIGLIVTVLALVGLLLFMTQKGRAHRWYILGIMSVPFIFNVATLYLGQSIIFIPGLTPGSFQWNLFNVRYGVMVIPCTAVLVGYLVYRMRGAAAKGAIVAAVAAQCAVFALGFAPVITYADGTTGLSSAILKIPDAQVWLSSHYDGGLVLADDYSRAYSIIRTSIPMKNTIYIGNKPYWDESLTDPEKWARWIIIQKDDAVWKAVYENPTVQARLFKYFNKVYTSDNVLIFKRISNT
jgi:hypothetical protein